MLLPHKWWHKINILFHFATSFLFQINNFFIKHFNLQLYVGLTHELFLLLGNLLLFMTNFIFHYSKAGFHLWNRLYFLLVFDVYVEHIFMTFGFFFKFSINSIVNLYALLCLIQQFLYPTRTNIRNWVCLTLALFRLVA